MGRYQLAPQDGRPPPSHTRSQQPFLHRGADEQRRIATQTPVVVDAVSWPDGAFGLRCPMDHVPLTPATSGNRSTASGREARRVAATGLDPAEPQ
jgi:hypothetical protein